MDIINDPNFKWLPVEMEQALGLTRTNHCIGDSFTRCHVVYDTAVPGVRLTNYDTSGQLEKDRMWKVWSKTKSGTITEEFLKDSPIGGKLLFKQFESEPDPGIWQTMGDGSVVRVRDAYPKDDMPDNDILTIEIVK